MTFGAFGFPFTTGAGFGAAVPAAGGFISPSGVPFAGAPFGFGGLPFGFGGAPFGFGGAPFGFGGAPFGFGGYPYTVAGGFGGAIPAAGGLISPGFGAI